MSQPEEERPVAGSDDPKIHASQHLRRILLLAAAVAILLGWLVAHTDILFADGLRYIAQARAHGLRPAGDGLKKAIDHPVYPLAIAAVHPLVGGDGPEDWQRAAQIASVIAGVLLIIPVYLVSRELFGDACAVPACVLFYLVPLTGHVFADTLSESTFLLFWMWGLWASLRFLKSGGIGWVLIVVGCSALAYLTRPEGLLLPAALLAALILSPRWVARGLGRRGLWALGVLVVGSACLVGPYVALKGGLGTKPSIARLLGTAPRSSAGAVERLRPLDPGQSEATTYLLAGRAVLRALGESMTWPLLTLAILGLLGVRPRDAAARQWRMLGVIGVASILALMRLHATGGYCSARHAMILSLILLPAAAFGLDWLIGWGLVFAKNWVPDRPPLKRLSWGVVLLFFAVINGSEILAPVNQGMDGYRQAGDWLAAHSSDQSHVVDVTGWSQFYGRRDGFTYESLVAAPADPMARWVVVREAHMKGPWEYCQRLRALVDGLEPVEVFRGSSRRRPTKVYVFDRQPRLASTPGADGSRR